MMNRGVLIGRLRLLHSRFDALFAAISHSWISAALLIFLVFAIACLRLDDYVILPDGLRSIATAGAFDAQPDVSLVYARLTDISQQHVPGYFLALHAWGNLAGWAPLSLRLLSLGFGLLSLALMYRMGRDFIGREAGCLALAMLASLYFYNLWHLPIRMYTLFAAAGLALLWIYFRIVIDGKRGLRHYALLCLTCLVFLNSQVFSLATLLGVGLFHLLFAAKTRSWLWTTLALSLSALLFLPWLSTLLTGAAEIAGGEFGDIQILTPIETIETIFSLGLNGSLPFLLPLALSLRALLQGDRISLALWLILGVATAFIIVVNEMTKAIDIHRSRYFVALLPLVILLVTRGMAHLNRSICFVMLLLWIASGMLFQRRVAPQLYVESYGAIPLHLIERHLRDDLREGDLITGWSEGLSFEYSTPYGRVADYYFAAHGARVVIEHNYWLDQRGDAESQSRLRGLIADRERVWLIYELDNTARWKQLYQGALEAGHQRCLRDRGLYNVAIELYQRSGCDA